MIAYDEAGEPASDALVGSELAARVCPNRAPLRLRAIGRRCRSPRSERRVAFAASPRGLNLRPRGQSSSSRSASRGRAGAVSRVGITARTVRFASPSVRSISGSRIHPEIHRGTPMPTCRARMQPLGAYSSTRPRFGTPDELRGMARDRFATESPGTGRKQSLNRRRVAQSVALSSSRVPRRAPFRL